jgi:hypothetical protein
VFGGHIPSRLVVVTPSSTAGWTGQDSGHYHLGSEQPREWWISRRQRTRPDGHEADRFPALALTNALAHPWGTLRPSIVITLSTAASLSTSTANVASCEPTLAPSTSFRFSLGERCTLVSIVPHRGNTARSTPHPDDTTHPAAGRRRFNQSPPAFNLTDIIHRPDGFATHATHATLRR